MSQDRSPATGGETPHCAIVGPSQLVKIDDGQSVHVRTAREWLDLARADLASQSETPLKTIIADLRVKNGKRPCGCESCDCANVGDAENVGSWDGADWVLNEIDKAIK